MARLLDSSVFIDLERRGLPLSVVSASSPDEPAALASVTAAELLFGAERANSPTRRRSRVAFLEQLFAYYYSGS